MKSKSKKIVKNSTKSLSDLRVSRNMTQKDLADIMHCTQATISAWELGKRVPPFSKILILSKVFDVPTDSLGFGK